MARDRFLIAPINTGLQTNMKPFLIPDDAFEAMENAYLYRGRIQKRAGTRVLNGTVAANVQQFFTRLGLVLGMTDNNGNAAGVVPGNIFTVGQQFYIVGEILTVTTNGVAQPLLTTGNSVSTYSTTNGAYNIVGSNPNANIFFLPSQPVMGIITFEQASLTLERYIFFDTQFSYEYNGTNFNIIGNGTGASLWTGSNSQFFWGETYRGATADLFFLFVTNFNEPDSIRYLDNTNTWNRFQPVIDSNNPADEILTCLCIASFKGRLLLFNVIEQVTVNNVQTPTNFNNRVRYSFVGNPIDTNAFNNDVNPSAGFIDADTREAIISIGFIKDRLIVFFERSTYELVYTGNDNMPFVFQRLNSELGVHCTYSTVLFDQAVLGIGQSGIHACNGSNVTRIDQKIPHEVFQILNQNNGVNRVQGIRDYYLELVYWILPTNISEQSVVFPNQMLVFNYRTNTWATNDDSFTALGNIQATVSLTWQNALIPWEEAAFTWGNATFNSQFLNVVAGNQEGFVFIVDPGMTVNADSLSITEIITGNELLTLTIVNHNLVDNDYVQINNIRSFGAELSAINGNIYSVIYIDNNTINIDAPNITDIYLGGGTLNRVTPPDILTKEYNFYLKEGVNFNINAIDFHIDATVNGEFNVDYYTDTSDDGLYEDGVESGASLGTGIIETSPYITIPYEQNQVRLWHRYFPQADGEFIQLRLYIDPSTFLSNEQPLNPQAGVPIISSQFAVHAMLFHCNPTASRLQ